MILESAGAASDGLSLGDEARLSENPIFIKENQMVMPEIKTLTGDGAGSYRNLVTRGAFCTGSSERSTRLVEVAFLKRTRLNLKVNSMSIYLSLERPIF